MPKCFDFVLSPSDAGGYDLLHVYDTPSDFGSILLSSFAGISPQDSRFADFNGDGITDVFVMFNCETIFANSDE